MKKVRKKYELLDGFVLRQPIWILHELKVVYDCLRRITVGIHLLPAPHIRT